MRRFDVWVGRVAAVAGLLYVALAGLWPLTAAGAERGDSWSASMAMVARIDRGLPSIPAPVDLRLARAIADVTSVRDQRREARRSAEMATIGTTSESTAMLLVATAMLCAAILTNMLRERVDRHTKAA